MEAPIIGHMNAIFLLTPLREGRPSPRRPGRPPSDISTHAPAGGATPPLSGHICSNTHFYSRPCGRGDDGRSPRPAAADSYFYSRPCGRGDQARTDTVSRGRIFLLTPLREGRHFVTLTLDPAKIISTHAPAGGATNLSRLNPPGLRISTHAPAGGATSPPLGLGPSTLISTHAPAGGATAAVKTAALPKEYFYSRPCGRGDLCRINQRH